MNNQFDECGNIVKEDLSRIEQFKLTRKKNIIVRKFLIEILNDLSNSINRLSYEIEKLEGNRKNI